MHAKSLQSCLTLCNPMDCSLPGSLCSWDSPGKNAGLSCHALHLGIFPTQGSNPSLKSPKLAGGFFTKAPPGKPYRASSSHQRKHKRIISYSWFHEMVP